MQNSLKSSGLWLELETQIWVQRAGHIMTFVDPIDTFDSVVSPHSNINIVNYFLCNLYASTFFFFLDKI